MNYNNQMDLSYDQMNNTMTNNTNYPNNYLNNYGVSEQNIPIQNNLPREMNFNTSVNGMGRMNLGLNTNMDTKITNDSLINIIPDIDYNLLNGTSLDDNDIIKKYSQNNNTDDNKSLIKSLTKEIIDNLKENNMSLYDNSSINSRSKKNTNTNTYDIEQDEQCSDELKSYDSSNLTKKLKKNKKKDITDIKNTIEEFVVNGETPNSTSYVQWFFDDCFNYKDFLILFILYFVLSQEMIKDFFAKYFYSLNPDDEGKIGVQGVIIYGLILTILFMIIKKLF